MHFSRRRVRGARSPRDPVDFITFVVCFSANRVSPLKNARARNVQQRPSRSSPFHTFAGLRGSKRRFSLALLTAVREAVISAALAFELNALSRLQIILFSKQNLELLPRRPARVHVAPRQPRLGTRSIIWSDFVLYLKLSTKQAAVAELAPGRLPASAFATCSRKGRAREGGSEENAGGCAQNARAKRLTQSRPGGG